MPLYKKIEIVSDYVAYCSDNDLQLMPLPLLMLLIFILDEILVFIPLLAKKEIACVLKRVASLVPHLHLVEADIPLNILCNDDQKLDHALGREFHISLGRSVPLRVHQINSLVSMLRQKLQLHKR